MVHGAFFYSICLSCGLYFKLFVSSAHTCTKQHYIITVISFTYQKVDKGTSQQVMAFVNVLNVSRLTAVHDSLQGHTRLAPLLNKIMFCLGPSYVKGVAILGHNKHLSMNTKCRVLFFQSINRFLSSATNTSIYHVLMIMP